MTAVPSGGFPPPGAEGASNPIGDVEAAGGAAPGVKDWRPPSTGAGTGSSKAGAAEAYQLTSGGAAASSAGAPKDSGNAALDAAYAEDEKPTAADARPWLFHIIMALGGLYLGMAITNWGTAEA
jgi:hypothetical protein